MNRTIQIIAVVLITAGLLYKVVPFFRRMKGTFKKIHLNPSASIDNEEYVKLALGAVYSEQQSAFINSLTTGIPVFEIKSMLANWWGIHDDASAKETLNSLLENARYSIFPVVMRSYKDGDISYIASEIPDAKKAEKAYTQFDNLGEVLADLKQDGMITGTADVERLGTDAWELGRLVYVARLCFDAGFIPEKETWSYITEAHSMAKQKFPGWQDFGHSYAIGRALWSGKDSANSGIAYIVKYLLTESQSPWVKLKW